MNTQSLGTRVFVLITLVLNLRLEYVLIDFIIKSVDYIRK